MVYYLCTYLEGVWTYECRYGGIGRHKRLKISRKKFRTGSTPVSGTTPAVGDSRTAGVFVSGSNAPAMREGSSFSFILPYVFLAASVTREESERFPLGFPAAWERARPAAHRRCFCIRRQCARDEGEFILFFYLAVRVYKRIPEKAWKQFASRFF